MGAKLHESIFSNGAHYSWLWWCPACEVPHECDTRWDMTGTKDAPTFRGADGRSSSVLVHAVPQIGQPLCHSVVTDGRIEYGTDCTHAMAGTTVEMPDWFGFSRPEQP